MIATGNNGYNDGICSPACVSRAVAVGATYFDNPYERDKVWSYSDSSNEVDLLAPGDMVWCATPGDSFQRDSGTSLAAPHVAGAFAVVKQKYPDATVGQILRGLTQLGVLAKKENDENNIERPRIHLANFNTDLGYYFKVKQGTTGSNTGQFKSWLAGNIALDSSGNVYVADYENSRIQKFDSNLVFTSAFGTASTPTGVAIDHFNNIWTVHRYDHSVKKWNPDGVLQNTFTGGTTEENAMLYPERLAFDTDGNFYVTTWFNERILKFKADGTFLTSWGGTGTDITQFEHPFGIAIDRWNNVYVTDRDNHRILKFNSDGTYIDHWGSHGSEEGQFSYPEGIAVDHNGVVYVADTYNSRIQWFNAAGDFLGSGGSYCDLSDGSVCYDSDYQFHYPRVSTVFSKCTIFGREK